LKKAADGGVATLITRRETGLAVRYGARFDSRLLRLEPGDTLLLYTDGLVEAPDKRGKPFGIDRLKRAFASAGGSPSRIKKALNRAAAAHRGLADQPDDKTFIVIQAVEQLRTGC
jgi:serine phosphatase RsbU (regulator of sigma subunit)